MLRSALAFDVGGWREEESAFRSRNQTARVALRFATTGDKELRLRMRPAGSSGRPLRVGVRLNDQALETLEMRNEAVFAVALPAATQHPEQNELEFVIGGGAPGRQQGASRAFVLTELEVRPGGAPAPPERGEGLWVPPGAEWSSYLRVGAGARLEVQADAGVGPLALQVALDLGGERRTLAVLTSGRGGSSSREIALDAAGGRVVSIVVTDTAGSGARLRRLRLTQAPEPPTTPARLEGRPDIVLFLVDTLGAGSLPAGADGPVRMPAFDAFARESVLFSDAWAQSSWTMPSIAALFTGLEPDRLGVYGPWGDLPDSSETLAEALSRLGYATGGFVANALLTRVRGYAQGFDAWHQEDARSVGRPGAQVVSEALAWLDGQQGPSFAYLHIMEPHAPYGHGGPELLALARKASPTPSEIERLRAAYRVDVEQADAAFGALLEGLRARGRLDRALVVFLADHGEEFFEHGGQGHGKTLYQEVLHIPLAARLPGARRGGVRENTPVQHTDLLPTLLGLVGGTPPAVDGRDLSALWSLGRPAAPEVLASRLLFEKRTYDKAAARWGSLKLILNEEMGAARRLEMYDLEADPAETADVLAARPVVAGYLLGELRERRSRAVAGGAAERKPRATDPDALERLRALGYVQ